MDKLIGTPNIKNDEIGKIVNNIRAIKSGMQRYSQELKKKFNITGQQLGVLHLINQFPGLTLKELGIRMYLHISTVSCIVVRLEKAGFLESKRREKDRRELEFRLTAKGKRIIKRAPISGMGIFIAELRRKPQREIRQISRVLEMLANILGVEDNDVHCIS
jgi:MarR family transcriptional regulator, organic hydroperoxide resistance regulator